VIPNFFGNEQNRMETLQSRFGLLKWRRCFGKNFRYEYEYAGSIARKQLFRAGVVGKITGGVPICKNGLGKDVWSAECSNKYFSSANRAGL